MLTSKQRKLLIYIFDYIKETGVSPSYDEMKEALDLASKSGIHRLITALEERGFIRRLPHKARALEVLRMPDAALTDGGMVHRTASNVSGFTNTGVGEAVMFGRPDMGAQGERNPGSFAAPHGNENKLLAGVFGSARKALQAGHGLDAGADVDGSGGESLAAIPLMGRIAAGTPIEAIQHQTDVVHVPTHLADQESEEYFALEVQGDSMIDAAILDGDIVIIKRRHSAQSGDIVVALVDDQEATLKKLRKRGGSVALEPANVNYETRIFTDDRVAIQGVMVGLIRSYR